MSGLFPGRGGSGILYGQGIGLSGIVEEEGDGGFGGFPDGKEAQAGLGIEEAIGGIEDIADEEAGGIVGGAEGFGAEAFDDDGVGG